MTASPYPRKSLEHAAYLAGARAEVEAIEKGMNSDAAWLYRYVRILAQQHNTVDYIAARVAENFTAGWPVRKVAALTWRMLSFSIRYRLREIWKSIR